MARTVQSGPVQTLSEIKAMLAAASLAPRKRLGQNFLVNHNLISRLVDAALGPSRAAPEGGIEAGTQGASHAEREAIGPGLQGADCRPRAVPPVGAPTILEVGPGTGTMTEELLGRGCRVVAAELDHGLCVLLRERLGDHPGFSLIEGDCLGGKAELAPAVVEGLAGHPFRLVSNLPYSAGTSVLLALLTRHSECAVMAVTVQREVAERLTAHPGTSEYGSVSIVAQCMATVRRIATLPPGCFWPRPDVTSAMVVLERRSEPLTDDPVALAAFCKRAFAGRRKQLRGLLKSMGWPDFAQLAIPEGIRPDCRIEELSPSQVAALERAGRAR